MLGVDLFQRYNTVTDWHQVTADGVRDVYVKLTNGTSVASVPGDAYVSGARSAGLSVGGYAYALAGDPAAQARAFAGELKRLNACDIAPALDYEDSSLPLSGQAGRAWVTTFLSALHQALPSLPKLALYASGSVLSALGAGSISVPGVQLIVWDAEYGANDGQAHPVHAYTGHIDIHQFTSAGSLPGIAGQVDLDNVFTDITEGIADVQLTDVVNTPIGPVSVGDLLGGLWQELKSELPTRATINADRTQKDTLFGRALDADGNAWDNGQRLIALDAKVTAQFAALTTAITHIAQGIPVDPAAVTAAAEAGAKAALASFQFTGQLTPAPATPAAPAAG
jgi:GH25 family lysozyme M1 (1,4-beta-N-acetylmuramidase)